MQDDTNDLMHSLDIQHFEEWYHNERKKTIPCDDS